MNVLITSRSLQTFKDNIALIKYNKLDDNILKYIQRIER